MPQQVTSLTSSRIPELTKCISLTLCLMAIVSRVYLPGFGTGIRENALIWIFSWGSILFLTIHWLYQPCRISLQPLEIALFTLAALACLSAFWANDLLAALEQNAHWLAGGGVFLAISYWLKQDSKLLPLFWAVLLATCFSEIVFSHYQYWVDLPITQQLVEKNPDLLQQLNIPASYQNLFHSRLSDHKAFGHFALSNSLGAYLLLFAPCLVSLLFQNSLSKKAILVLLGFLVLATLVLTGSRGSLLCLMLAVGLLIGKRLTTRLQIGLAVATVLFSLVALMLSLTTNTLDFLGQRMTSFWMRWEYWLATGKIWLSSPFLGVGSDNFANHYYRYKSIWAEEVNNAHNFYWQWLAEMGIVGGLLLAVTVLLLWRQGNHQQTNFSKSFFLTGNPYRWLILAPVAALFLVGYLGQAFNSDALLRFFSWPLSYATPAYLIASLIFTACWLLFFLLFLRLSLPPLLGWGLVAFLLHSALDINLYEPTLFLTFCALLAIFVHLRPTSALVWTPPETLRRTFALAVCATIIFLATQSIPRLMQGEKLIENALYLKNQLERDPQPGTFRNYQNTLAQALTVFPHAPQPNILVAYLLTFEAQKQARERNVPQIAPLLETAQEHLEKARYYQKENIAWHHTAVQIYLIQAKVWRNSNQLAKQQQAVEQAYQYAQKLEQLYPSKPMFVLLVARLLRQQGKQNQAVAKYRRALFVDDHVFFGSYGLSSQQRQEALQQAILNK